MRFAFHQPGGEQTPSARPGAAAGFPGW
jgi:hypothetical protein